MSPPTSEPSIVVRAGDRSRQLVREDRYVVVLLLILGSIMTTAFLGDGPFGLLVTLAFMSLTLLVALSTSDVGRRVQMAGRIFVVAAFAVVVAAGLANREPVALLGFFATMIALSVATPLAIGRRLWKHPVISTNTIAGAADIYLLIGLLFAVIYTCIGTIQAGGLGVVSSGQGQHIAPHAAFFYAARPTQPSDFIYFSYTTLSTVGYGDLTSTSEVGRLLSNTEALFGQLYLVTVVAVLVSNIGRVRRQPTPGATEDAEAR